MISIALGNALELFDFATYAFFAAVISRQFFPPGDPTTALIGAYAVFGIGLVARPLGAVFFGRLGDTHGRKIALVIAMPLMAAGTIMIGVMPTYTQIGIAAPILLVMFRLMQGFSAGGEPGNAIAFLIEWSPPKRRAFYSSLQQASGITGTIVGSVIAASLTTVLPTEALESWGWRIPFLIGGILIAPLGFYLRSRVEETPVFMENQHMTGDAGHRGLGPPWALGARTIGITALWVVSFYVFLIYAPSFLTVHGKIHASEALWVNTAGLVMMLISIVVSASLSDLIGRRPLLIAATVCLLVFSYPLFYLLVNTSSLLLASVGIVLAGGVIGIFAGICPATMAEMFPTHMRTTGVSIGFGISTAVFGGFASLISESLIKYTGSEVAPAYYVLAAAVITLIVLPSIKETAHVPLK